MLKKGLKATSIVTPSNYLQQHSFDAEPVKPVQFKTTMRKEKKHNFNEEKPWKYHSEREFITDSERRRYESIWVSNKGLYMDLLDPKLLNMEVPIPDQFNNALKASVISTNSDLLTVESNLILNVVVRDIWERSRLPNETLRQIWSLVDKRQDRTLDRVSFVVGMWLIDQCLYGRKLPKTVHANVWNSALQLGINVSVKKR